MVVVVAVAGTVAVAVQARFCTANQSRSPLERSRVWSLVPAEAVLQTVMCPVATVVIQRLTARRLRAAVAVAATAGIEALNTPAVGQAVLAVATVKSPPVHR